MEKFLFIGLPIVGVIAIIVGIIVLVKKYEKQRTASLAALADELSLTFLPDGDAVLVSKLSDLPLMQMGHSRKLHNLITGQTQSVDLSLFDYRYTTGGGKNQSTHSLSVAVFQSPLLRLPVFSLGAENFMHRIANTFGYQDIDVAGYPTFNKKYLLRGPDEEAVRMLFNEDVLQHFEAQLEKRKGICEVQGQGSMLMVSTSRQKPDELRPFLAHAFATFGMVKSADPPGSSPKGTN